MLNGKNLAGAEWYSTSTRSSTPLKWSRDILNITHAWLKTFKELPKIFFELKNNVN
jgi:hypothetical protein